MAQATCEIMEIGLAGSERLIRMACPPRMIPAPGQYLLAAGQGTGDILSTPLFIAGDSPDYAEFCGNLPQDWTPGTRIVLRGPFGQGFHLPDKARRVAVVTLIDNSLRLLPVIRAEINRSASVSLFSASLMHGLPAEAEALPLESVADAWAWADYVLIEARLKEIPRLRDLLAIADGSQPACPAEVLIITDMPCGGIADCGVCAISTGRRYQLVCKDGPVFHLNSVI